MEHKQQKLSRHLERIQQLKAECNNLVSEKLKLDRDLQQRHKLEQTKEELISGNKSIEQVIQVSYVFWKSEVLN